MPSRRALLLAAGGSLLATVCNAETAEADAAAPAGGGGAAVNAVPSGIGASNAIILDPIALAILHHARDNTNWSSRQKIRSYLRTSGPTGLFGINPLASPAANSLSPDARAIGTAWQNVLLSVNVFQRARDLDKLTSLVDAYAARVLNAERYFLPLNGQGFLAYDFLEEDLINDAGLVEPNCRVGAMRFSTLDQGAAGAIQVLNLHVQQLSPSLKAPSELHRIPTPDTELAERLMKEKAAMYQVLEVQLRGASKCFPRAEAMRGVARPLSALAVEFAVVDGAGNKLHSKAIDHRIRPAKKGICAKAAA